MHYYADIRRDAQDGEAQSFEGLDSLENEVSSLSEGRTFHQSELDLVYHHQNQLLPAILLPKT